MIHRRRALQAIGAMAMAEPGMPAGVQFTVSNNAAANPMVKTGPNIKEPQNRRVVITVA